MPELREPKFEFEKKSETEIEYPKVEMINKGNISLEIRRGEGAFEDDIGEITIINKKGERFSIKSLLPNAEKCFFKFTNELGRFHHALGPFGDIIFIPEYSFSSSEFQKRLGIPETRRFWEQKEGLRKTFKEFLKRKLTFSLDGSMLALLHEIGHIHEPKEFKEKHIFYLEKIKLFKESREPISEDFKKNVEEYVIGAERNSWAYALKTLRELKKKGFDCEPNLRTFKDVKPLVEESLMSYHKLLEIDEYQKNKKTILQKLLSLINEERK